MSVARVLRVVPLIAPAGINQCFAHDLFLCIDQHGASYQSVLRVTCEEPLVRKLAVLLAVSIIIFGTLCTSDVLRQHIKELKAELVTTLTNLHGYYAHFGIIPTSKEPP
uniref:Putative secreted protein n=1 Tax=Ixodes ricinus TaxID=34613 RepID=A0A6B0UAG6_IXORI